MILPHNCEFIFLPFFQEKINIRVWSWNVSIKDKICNVIWIIELFGRPYSGKYEGSDPQRKLALPYPTLPRGNVPRGFIGYAVNMIDLDIDHLHTRTAAGHGLRETVLYRLLGEVQVYETRECMLEARRCIKHGAVSLDGGILRENGVISLGYGSLSLSLSLSRCEIMCETIFSFSFFA